MPARISPTTTDWIYGGLGDPAAANEVIVALNHSGTKEGFFGVTPVVQPTGGAATAAGTYGANEQTMLQTAYNALRTLGLLT